jgi:hypothetical protein
MKIYFRSLSAVKKEVMTLRKKIKKTTTIQPLLQELQDLVARFYGWHHYNQMSYDHARLDRINAFTPLTKVLLEKEDIVSISDMERSQRDRLESRKHRLLTVYLRALGVESNKVDDALVAVFTQDNELIGGNELIETVPISQLWRLTRNDWCMQNCVFGNDIERLKRLYMDVPLNNAYRRGGVMLLRESIALPMIEKIQKAGITKNVSHLQYAYLGDSSHYEQPVLLGAKSFDPFLSETFDITTEMIVSMIHNNQGDEMWRGQACRLVSSIVKLVYGISKKTKRVMTSSDFYDALNLDNLMKLVVDNGDIDSRYISPVQQYIESLPAFSWQDHKENTVKSNCYQRHAYAAMQITKTACFLKDAVRDDRDNLMLTKAIKNNDIVIGILPETARNSPLASMCMAALFRNSGSEWARTVEQVKGDCHHKTDYFKPVIMDCFESYRQIEGAAVRASQGRAIGQSFFFGIGDISILRLNSREEYASIIANATNRFFVERREDIVDAFDEIAQLPLSPPLENQHGDRYDINPKTLLDKNVIFTALAAGNIVYQAHNTNPVYRVSGRPFKILTLAK